jgi:hypothetical protein
MARATTRASRAGSAEPAETVLEVMVTGPDCPQRREEASVGRRPRVLIPGASHRPVSTTASSRAQRPLPVTCAPFALPCVRQPVRSLPCPGTPSAGGAAVVALMADGAQTISH